MLRWLEKHREVSFAITFIIATAIFYISSLSFPYSASPQPTYYSILYHLTAFFLLGFFLLISLVNGKNKKLIIPAILLSIFYGISDEIHQYFVPGRNMSLGDVFIDSVGVIAAAVIYKISLRQKIIAEDKIF